MTNFKSPLIVDYPNFSWDFPDEMPYGQTKLLKRKALLEWEKKYIEDMQCVSTNTELCERYVEHLVDVTNLLAEVKRQLKEKYNA